MEKLTQFLINFKDTYFMFLEKITNSNGSKIILGMFIFCLFTYILTSTLYNRKNRWKL